jgi:hypothetical protein
MIFATKLCNRDSVHTTVTQTSLAPDLTPVPAPCFQDDNISVYGIPIFPTTDVFSAPEDRSELTKAREKRKKKIRFMFPMGSKHGGKHDLGPDHPFYERLPKLHEKYTHVLRPSTAYIAIVSPILAAKADALGVSPRQRSILRAGISVTVTVREGNNTTTKIVRPEDCMAAPENPTVGPSPFFLAISHSSNRS